MLGFSVADINQERFVDAPIPTAQVLEGNPIGRSCDLHSSREGGVSMNLWDCTAGRFRWHFLSDELVEILEGEVRVVGDDGTLCVLRPGDTAHFPAGTSFVWEVPVYVKKLAIHRAAKTLPDRALLKVTRALERRRSAIGTRLSPLPLVPVDLLACLATLPA
jgi:uncharacterized protein